MKRVLISCALALPLVALAAGPALAEVKSREKSQVKFEGMLGRAIGMFGGKAAREGVVSTTAVKGNRKATTSDTTARIVDLSEEKIYEIDIKDKSYKVQTFDELRAAMRKAREEAEKQAQRTQKEGKEEKTEAPQKSGREVEVDFDAKETGQKKSLAGYETRQVLMTVTVREKGKTLDDGGGLVMTADTWMAPTIAALKESADFELRFWKQIQGTETPGVSPQQMAMAVAQFPMIKDAMERLQKEGAALKGTPLATTTTFESVKSKAQMAQPAQRTESGGGGLGGLLAKKILKTDDGEAKARSVIFTINSEVQEVSTTVGAADLEVPAGFKEKK